MPDDGERNADHGVERAPDWTEQPVGGIPHWSDEVLVPVTQRATGNEAADASKEFGDDHTEHDPECEGDVSGTHVSSIAAIEGCDTISLSDFGER